MAARSTAFLWLALALAALIALPFVTEKFYVQFATKVLIMGIFAVSLNLLVGYAGLISLGHAAFFGFAGYLLALVTPQYEAASLWVSLPVSVAGTALLAALVGSLVIRTSGIYFIMVTLAFAQMLYYLFHDTGVAGGSDGIYIYIRPVAGIFGWQPLELDNFTHLSCTCFVRFVIVLGFVRTGIGTPSAPPNQVLVGLALFMSLFVSAPVATEIYERAGRGYLSGQLDEKQALEAATPALRTFLLHHTTEPDLALFYDVSNAPRPTTIDEVPLKIAIPAFVLSELRLAFKIGLTVLLPFLVIDLVAATILTALGMVMVPPQVVALPIKLLVFVLIDGWHLIVQSLIRGAMGT